MKKAITIFAAAVLFCALPFTGCDESDESNSVYYFSIYSTGNSFYGRIKIDDDPYRIIDTDLITKDFNYFVYEEDLDNATNVYIIATGYKVNDPLTPLVANATDSIYIELFENGNRIKEDIEELSTEEITITAELDWSYTENDSTTTE